MVPRLALALLVLLAGCVAVPGGDAGPADGENTPAPTATPGAPTDATAANTIAYDDLSPVEQRAFDAAAAGGAEFFHDAPHVEGDFFDPDVAAPFRRNRYVRKDSTYYRLSHQSGALYASYGIGAAEGKPSQNDTVVAYENLSERSREPVRRAIEDGAYTVPFGTWSSAPDDLYGRPYVRYSGTHYRIDLVVGDAWVQVWTAEAVG